jgi:hypothetical protein
MWVSEYQDIDPNVFVWIRRPPVPPATEDIDEYVNVASASDMAEYPVDNPDPELPPFYRKSAIDILFRSVDLMNKSINTIEGDLASLIKNLDYIDTHELESEIVITGEVIP